MTFADQVHELTSKQFIVSPLATEEGAPVCLGAVYGLELLSVAIDDATHGASEHLA